MQGIETFNELQNSTQLSREHTLHQYAQKESSKMEENREANFLLAGPISLTSHLDVGKPWENDNSIPRANKPILEYIVDQSLIV